MTRPVLFTGDIFRLQPRGGITRYFDELIPRLRRPSRVVAGLHQSRTLPQGNVESSVYMPGFRLSPRPRAVVNRWVDSARIQRNSDEILHPTYYRDPKRLPSLPMVLTVYDMAHERFPEHFRRRRWNSDDPARWKKAITDRADRIVCISESTQRDLIDLLHVEERKTRVIHCGATDWSRVTAEAVEGIPQPFFLWVGERHTYKNFAATLEAWAASKAKGETSLLCVGGGPLRESERADRAHQRTLSDAGLKWAYEHAAGLLYTSRCEGFGLPLVEAMSLGCPVVASNGSSMPEVAGDVAVYVDPESVDSIREGIERCLETGRNRDISERLRARAAHFSWDRCAEAHEAVYRELD